MTAVYRFIFCLVAFHSVQLNFGQRSSRIVGGHFAEKNQFPYLVAVLFNDRLRCGGNIIADNWILTAAHCVTEKP